MFVHHTGNRSRTTRTFLFSLLMIALVAGSWTIASNAAGPSTDQPTQAQREGIKHAQDLSEAFKFAAHAAGPSVVKIMTVEHVQVARRSGFFSQPRPETLERTGLGTGVILSPDGYIVTNNHVVGEAPDDIAVILADGKEYRADVVGTDKETDLAVIHINAKNLPALELGDSSSLEVGEWVIAIGSPFGLENTVTAGIISATGRANMNLALYENFLQTDAAINPGNSGGPLINLEGKVIGINTAIATQNNTASYAGIGFAIPSDMVRGVFESIVRSGSVDRGFLGISMQELTPTLAQSFGFEGDSGVIVTSVEPGTPADEAGLIHGDIITALNGKQLRDMNDLRSKVAAIEPGSTAKLEVFRNGKMRDFSVDVARRDRLVQASSRSTSHPQPQPRTWQPGYVGMSVAQANPRYARQAGLRNGDGVVVAEVENESPADQAGLSPGFIVAEVNGKPIDSVQNYDEAMNAADTSKGILLRILIPDRQGNFGAQYTVLQWNN